MIRFVVTSGDVVKCAKFIIMVKLMRLSIIKIISYLFVAGMFCCTQIAIAYAGGAVVTIRDGSIQWQDADQRMKMLESAPGWDQATIQSIFTAYRDSSHNQLPMTAKPRQYDIEFINGMWGPVNNPFVKVTRPAKAFVSFHSSSEFYMAPLIKNISDGNFYIFDKEQAHPVLLSEWIAKIAASHGGLSNLYFNVCGSYADDVNDSCAAKSYQAETRDALGGRMGLRDAASNAAPSAARAIAEDWQSMVSKSKMLSRNMGGSIYDNSIDWKNGNQKNNLLAAVNSWSNVKIIQENFEKIRDIRYFNDTMVEGFVRRISWLYPDDGCWTRATAVVKDLFGPQHNVVNQYQRPSKIFAFGNLCVNTSHASDGYVSWWYHTAPVIRDAETHQVYVLDPAVEPRKPLTVDQWMAAIADNTGACANRGDRANTVSRFGICNGYGTNPSSRCDSGFQEEESTDVLQPGFQERERVRQVELGRNANMVLGDSPPWVN